MREHPLDVTIVVLTSLHHERRDIAERGPRPEASPRAPRLGPLVRKLLTTEGLRYAALLALLTAFAGGAAFASIENTSIGIGSC